MINWRENWLEIINSVRQPWADHINIFLKEGYDVSKVQ
jgi:hypothetical protein